MHPLVVAERLVDLQPGRRPAGPVPGLAPDPLLGDEGAIEDGAPRVVLELVGRRDVRHRDRLDVRRRLGPLEAGLEVQDGSDGLSGHDTPGAERPSVADSVHLEADRLGVVAPPDEVGADRVRRHLVIDRPAGRPERLGHDLAAVEAAPRVLQARRPRRRRGRGRRVRASHSAALGSSSVARCHRSSGVSMTQ